MKLAQAGIFATAGFFGLCAVANAAPIAFNFLFADPEGPARAAGSITFESTLLPNPGSTSFTLPDPAVLALNVTVTGTTGGDGTFTLADFAEVRFETNGGQLDLTRELVGQATSGSPWGTTQDGNSGDFNLFGADCQMTAQPSSSGGYPGRPRAPAAALPGLPPLGDYYFTLGAACDTGELMVLVSFTPVSNSVHPAPALGTWTLLGLAVLFACGGAFAVRRRARRA